jgi:hypothetical protein
MSALGSGARQCCCAEQRSWPWPKRFGTVDGCRMVSVRCVDQQRQPSLIVCPHPQSTHLACHSVLRSLVPCAAAQASLAVSRWQRLYERSFIKSQHHLSQLELACSAESRSHCGRVCATRLLMVRDESARLGKRIGARDDTRQLRF